jgi:hypothetical protein
MMALDRRPRDENGKPCKGHKITVVDANRCQEIADMAKFGMSLDQIAAVVGVSPSTLDNLIAEGKRRAAGGDNAPDNLYCAIEKARGSLDRGLALSAYKKALEKDDTTMQIFLCKTRLGWRETQEFDHRLSFEPVIVTRPSAGQQTELNIERARYALPEAETIEAEAREVKPGKEVKEKVMLRKKGKTCENR